MPNSPFWGTKRALPKWKKGLPNFAAKGFTITRVQIEGLNDQYATALAEGYISRAASILGKMERLSPFANEFNKITTKLEDAYEQEAVLKKRYDLNKLDSESQIPAAFVVDRAAVADKKARPIVGSLLVMGGHFRGPCSLGLLPLPRRGELMSFLDSKIKGSKASNSAVLPVVIGYALLLGAAIAFQVYALAAVPLIIGVVALSLRAEIGSCSGSSPRCP